MQFIKIIGLLVISLSSFASVEFKKFDDPKQEEAYKVLIEEIRCLVCQNQTIADSNADLAKDLRRQVYEMLQNGQTKDEIAAFMTDRYGDFVLYNPPFKAKTGLLWIAPVLFLLIGLIVLVLYGRKKKMDIKKPTQEDTIKKEKIKALLDANEKNEGDSL